MSRVRIPAPGLLVLSILSSRWEEFWPGLVGRLEARLGPVALAAAPVPFTETGYYDAELGTPIVRRMLAFGNLWPLDGLPGVKLFTNGLELEREEDGRRLFNLDPGLLTQERLVLASCKNFTHRVYLGEGVFADLTLIFQKGRWQVLPWTFRDYAGAALLRQLTDFRNLYREKLGLPGQD